LRKVGWVERQVRRTDRFQQRHAVLVVPWAVARKFGDDQAGGKAALMAYYGLFALFSGTSRTSTGQACGRAMRVRSR
jgi:hypothetical protein